MKHLYLLLTVISLSIAAQAQMKVITLEHSGNTSVFTNLDSALQNAAAGDDIYLPGGPLTFSGVIRKSVNLYGAGFYPDSTLATGQTIITVPLLLKTGASNCFITGLLITGNMRIDTCTNVGISRCQIGTVATNTLTFNRANNINIDGSVLNALYDSAHYATALSVSNSLLYGFVACDNATFNNNIFFYINVFYGATTPTNPFNYPVVGNNRYVTNSIFKSNIFYSPTNTLLTSSTQPNYFYNNVFTDTIVNQGGTSILTGNQFNRQLSAIFVGSLNTNVYTTTDNFHLKTGSPATGAGIGGTDAGIYGGANPFKEGAVPLNPHIQKFSVPANTDQSGNLRINISVGAQNN